MCKSLIDARRGTDLLKVTTFESLTQAPSIKKSGRRFQTVETLATPHSRQPL